MYLQGLREVCGYTNTDSKTKSYIKLTFGVAAIAVGIGLGTANIPSDGSHILDKMKRVSSDPMESVDAYENTDVLNFLNLRSEAYTARLQKQGYEGLSNAQKMGSHLKQQNYAELLKHVWTEADPAAKLSWLKNRAEEGHPIFMSEYALELAKQEPNLKTLHYEVMPWLKAGILRTSIDAKCTPDRTVEGAAGFMDFSYRSQIEEIARKKFDSDKVQEFVIPRQKQILRKTVDIATKALSCFTDQPPCKAIPSPKWVFSHGMGMVFGEENTIPASRWSSIRSVEAIELLAQINQLLD